MRAGHRTYMEVHLGVIKAKLLRLARLMEVDGVALYDAFKSSRGVFSGVARYSESVYSLWACTVRDI